MSQQDYEAYKLGAAVLPVLSFIFIAAIIMTVIYRLGRIVTLLKQNLEWLEYISNQIKASQAHRMTPNEIAAHQQTPSE